MPHQRRRRRCRGAPKPKPNPEWDTSGSLEEGEVREKVKGSGWELVERKRSKKSADGVQVLAADPPRPEAPAELLTPQSRSSKGGANVAVAPAVQAVSSNAVRNTLTAPADAPCIPATPDEPSSGDEDDPLYHGPLPAASQPSSRPRRETRPPNAAFNVALPSPSSSRIQNSLFGTR